MIPLSRSLNVQCLFFVYNFLYLLNLQKINVTQSEQRNLKFVQKEIQKNTYLPNSPWTIYFELSDSVLIGVLGVKASSLSSATWLQPMATWTLGLFIVDKSHTQSIVKLTKWSAKDNKEDTLDRKLNYQKFSAVFLNFISLKN